MYRLPSWSNDREQVPRKQGLKLNRHYIQAFCCRRSRASSTKTRIETILGDLKFPLSLWDREQVPRKQGLKPGSNPRRSARNIITIESKFHENKDWNLWMPLGFGLSVDDREQVPRKQGLKLNFPVNSVLTMSKIESKFHEKKDWNRIRRVIPLAQVLWSRASSTKTRIETPLASTDFWPLSQWSKASSTKTRIETCNTGRAWGRYNDREQVPRKQGLKLVMLCLAQPALAGIESKFHENKDWNSGVPLVVEISPIPIESKFHENKDWNVGQKKENHGYKPWSRASSTKTRIETPSQLQQRPSHWTDREQVPRKQGLKHPIEPRTVAEFKIESKFHENKDWNLVWCRLHTTRRLWSRASSTKTRIETPIHKHPDLSGCLRSRASSTKTRIETIFPMMGISILLMIESKFHENKDWNLENDSSRDLDATRDREQVPRKQGLKQMTAQSSTTARSGSRASSTKTRIETRIRISFLYHHNRSRASSTKTRIETCYLMYMLKYVWLRSRASSTKTRIETVARILV